MFSGFEAEGGGLIGIQRGDRLFFRAWHWVWGIYHL